MKKKSDKWVIIDGQLMPRKKAARLFGCTVNTVRNRVIEFGRKLTAAQMEAKPVGRKRAEKKIVTDWQNRKLKKIPGPTKWERELWGMA